MSHGLLALDGQGQTAESGEEAFRRIAARKLRERGCPEAEVASAVERLLAKPMGFEIGNDTGS